MECLCKRVLPYLKMSILKRTKPLELLDLQGLSGEILLPSHLLQGHL